MVAFSSIVKFNMELYTWNFFDIDENHVADIFCIIMRSHMVTICMTK